MRSKGRKRYFAGNQVNFLVTEDFVEVLNNFVNYCDKNSINASGAMRNAIKEWYLVRNAEENKSAMQSGNKNIRKIVEAYEKSMVMGV